MKKYIESLVGTLPALVLAAAIPAVQASTLQPSGLNLGGTSYMDGFGKAGPGFAYIGLLQYRNNDKFYDNDGNDNPAFARPRLRSMVMLNQLAYTSGVRVFGGLVGATALLPMVRLGSSVNPDSFVQLNSPEDAKQGDLTLGLFLQMDPVIENGRPVFSQRFEIDVIAPTGHYDTKYTANIGANTWSLNPYWAMTFLPTPALEFSTRLHYLYNYRNTDPGFGPAIRDVQAGQAVWANFAASYQVLPNLNVGLNGYWFRQITDDKLNGGRDPVAGVMARGVRTTDLSMGPGALWKVNPETLVFANVYLPVTVRNTPGGFHMNLRLIRDF
jgi:hypothetical protein